MGNIYCMSTEINNSLDLILKSLYSLNQMNRSEIESLMLGQLTAESERLRGYIDRQSELRPAFEEYTRIREASGIAQGRVNRLAALIGNKRLKKHGGIDPVILKRLDESTTRVSLWEASVLILENVPELQIVELHKTLQGLGFNASRQALESALDYHKEKFTIRVEGRSKFVSLAG